jgi:hypothetical protein
MKRIFTTIFVAAMLMFPAASLADSSSSCLAYNAPSVCSASAQRTTPTVATTAATTNSASTGSLPFTGLDVALLVAGGVTLLGAGLIVRKLSSSATE